MEELLKGKKLADLPQEHQENLAILLEKMNKIRDLWGKPMTVTSGYRSLEDHLRIYAEKGITDHSKIPMKSKHLYGQACDVFDPDLSMTKWLKDNPNILIDLDLYCEQGNKNWTHYQIVPPSSKSRWFLP
jgi:uncharacterized protein YcbK (DUF882 family)